MGTGKCGLRGFNCFLQCSGLGRSQMTTPWSAWSRPSGIQKLLLLVKQFMECVSRAVMILATMREAHLLACISGQVQSGKYDESFNLFREMCYFSRRPDSILIASLLSACASTATISCSKEIHCYAVRVGADTDTKVSSSLMDAYAKCGFAELGYLVFRQIPNKNSVMYNMVISNLGSHGFVMKAIEVHDEMVRDKLRPDGATFSALVAACCHAGLLDE
uniref:Pentatricopeptide repeat-containing protein n=1 Tax=Aegilops tauschii subsp. strangulata TaxID=200361 RepID=A0A453EVI8_AEGTS